MLNFIGENKIKYIIEDWLTEEIIQVFSSEEERDEWIEDNCTWFSDGCFITDTENKNFNL